MVTHIVMPVRDQLHLTETICRQLTIQPGWDRAWIFDNGSVDKTAGYLRDLHARDRRFTRVDATDSDIYSMWDSGFRRAPRSANVAIINNDLHLAPNTFVELSRVLDDHADVGVVYPNYDLEVADGVTARGIRYTSGTYRHGGMSGFCFMVRASAVDWEPLVDPRFRWWGGDDDIAFNLEARGWLQARVEGLPVDHLHEGTARHHDLGFTKAEDMARIIEKWGR
jgi:hypothetical protein